MGRRGGDEDGAERTEHRGVRLIRVRRTEVQLGEDEMGMWEKELLCRGWGWMVSLISV